MAPYLDHDVLVRRDGAPRETTMKTWTYLKRQFGREYDEMVSDLRVRGMAPSSTRQQYIDRRCDEIVQWNRSGTHVNGVALW